MDSEEEKNVPGYRNHPEANVLPKYGKFWRFAQMFQAGATTLALSLLNIPKYIGEGYFVVKVLNLRPEISKSVIIDRSILMSGLLYALYCHGIGKGFFMLMWSWSLHGILFNVFSQISHINEHCMPEAIVVRQTPYPSDPLYHIKTCSFSPFKYYLRPIKRSKGPRK